MSLKLTKCELVAAAELHERNAIQALWDAHLACEKARECPASKNLLAGIRLAENLLQEARRDWERSCELRKAQVAP